MLLKGLIYSESLYTCKWDIYPLKYRKGDGTVLEVDVKYESARGSWIKRN